MTYLFDKQNLKEYNDNDKKTIGVKRPLKDVAVGRNPKIYPYRHRHIS